MVGTVVSHYRILEQLGAGGMGVVYKAEDTRLGRHVALKFLPDAYASDAASLQRFQREARTASALNHPHICTIYDIGEWEGRPYLVMELLHGVTLRHRISAGPLAVDEVLELGIQIADGLAAAHARNIVHRDIKPANIFLVARTSGAPLAKILDFGLAKLTAGDLTATAAMGSQAATALLGEELLTSPGTAVGTVAYMSPEQARGHEVDARGDLFSLGVVLYEMSTGVRPFSGPAMGAIFESILRTDPQPPSSLNSRIPPDLDRIILRALEKEREVRYQTASDLQADLRRAKRDTETGRSAAVSAAVAPPPPRPRKLARLAVWIAAAAAIVAAAGWVLLRPRPTSPTSSAEWQAITNYSDSATQPALSPDGRMLTFIRGPQTFITPGQVYLKLMPGGEPAPLTHDNEPKLAPVFSPDGSRVAWSVVNPGWDTWVAPVIGGEPHLMLPNASGLTWIDPQHILFSEIKSGAHMALVTSAESRAGERDIYVPPHIRGMVHRSYLSPDRKSVLLAEMDNGGFVPCRVVPFDGSTPGKRVGPPNGRCTAGAWSPDGSWMYLSVNTGDGFHIWRQRSDGDRLEQITFGPTEQEGIAMGRDGRWLISSVGSTEGSLWIHDAAGERQLSGEGSAFDVRFAPDGSKIYYLASSAADAGAVNNQEFFKSELWAADPASGKSDRVLPGSTVSFYAISNDGKRVVYSNRDSSGKRRVWISPLDRRTAPQPVLTEADDEVWFGGPDELIFRSVEGSLNYVYRSQLDGSGRRKVLSDPILEIASVSPDGRWIMVWKPVPEHDGESAAVLVFPTAGGEGVEICRLCIPRWSTDGKWIVFERISEMNAGTTLILPTLPGTALPALRPGGIGPRADLKSAGARLLPENATPGLDPSTYAWVKLAVHRNLYRIPLQ